MKKDNWLIDYKKKIESQFGEEGILERIFEILYKLKKKGGGWCVEFGAWDGKFLSNCHYFIKERDWKGILIESSKKRFKDLVKNYSKNKETILINKFVNFEGESSLDNILEKTKIPKDFDLLSIDIDGNDYHIWDSLKKYSPKVVIIEFNPSIPNDIEFIQKRDMKVNHGSSLLAMVRLGKKKDYELICATECNAIFIKRKYFSLFKIKDNSPERLNPKKHFPRVFQLYDGTILLTEGFKLRWYKKVVVNKTDFQVLPKFFRFFDESCNSKLQKFLKKVYIKIRF